MENLLKRKISEKVKEQRSYLSNDKQMKLVERLLECDSRLRVNIEEWAEDRSLSDIWIKDKYCVGAVLKMRNDKDFISAIIDLNEYLKDESKENILWRSRK